MSEPASALNGAEFDGICHVAEDGLHGMITLRGDLGSSQVSDALRDVMGLAMPAQREVVASGATAAAWMSPDELLLMCPYGEAGERVARLTEALGESHALLADVSDARARFVLRGAHLRDVIAKLAPVDMAPEAFAPGVIRRTRFAQVAAAVWLSDAEIAQIVCFRSVAPYMFDLLCTAAAPGTEVGLF